MAQQYPAGAGSFFPFLKPSNSLSYRCMYPSVLYLPVPASSLLPVVLSAAFLHPSARPLDRLLLHHPQVIG